MLADDDQRRIDGIATHCAIDQSASRTSMTTSDAAPMTRR